jgi:hypothetical protein
MRLHRKIRYGVACLIALSHGMAAAGDLTLTAGLDASIGKYGSPDTTVVRYLPVIVKYEQGRSTYKVTLPYVSITSNSNVSVDQDGNVITASGVGQRVTQSGQGDVVAAYTYSLIDQPRHGWLVDLTAKIKLPTGDKSKGLSTGERDYSVLADFYYPAGKWTPFLTLGYRMPGNPPGGALQNTWLGSLGAGYKVSDTDSAGCMFDARQASSASLAGTRELTVYWVHKFTPATKLQFYAVKGFSDASPDYGLGAMVSQKF